MQLFQPNNLSRVKPEFIPIFDVELIVQISDALKAYAFYESGPIGLYKPCGANVVTLNLVVELNSARYFLKRREISERHLLRKEAQLAAELFTLGVKVPHVIPTKDQSVIHSDDKHCYAVYSFQDGDYFSGRGNQLDSAAAAFADCTIAAEKLLTRDNSDLDTDFISFLGDLPDLLNEASASSDEATRELVKDHSTKVHNCLAQVEADIKKFTSTLRPLHMDFHPLNLLVKNDAVVCILDFEHLKLYPIVAGVGFGGYKLIRQAMVLDDIRSQEMKNPSLVTRWLEGVQSGFPELTLTASEFALGAHYQVLFLIRLILHSYLRLGDRRFLYDLEKQILSLYEVDAIAGLYVAQR